MKDGAILVKEDWEVYKMGCAYKMVPTENQTWGLPARREDLQNGWPESDIVAILLEMFFLKV